MYACESIVKIGLVFSFLNNPVGPGCGGLGREISPFVGKIGLVYLATFHFSELTGER